MRAVGVTANTNIAKSELTPARVNTPGNFFKTEASADALEKLVMV